MGTGQSRSNDEMDTEGQGARWGAGGGARGGCPHVITCLQVCQDHLVTD